MNNHIVIESCKTLRGISRQALKGNWKKVAIGFLIFYSFTTLLPALIDALFGRSTTYEIDGLAYTVNVSFGSSIYLLIVSGAFAFGISAFVLSFLRTRNSDYNLIYCGFSKKFFKYLGLTLLIGIKVFLWGMLFVIPGVIAGIRYSQSFFVLYDHPEYSITECINESKRIMTGNKAKFFKLDLSFIGWSILAALPAGILSGLIEAGVIPTIGDIPMLFVNVVVSIPLFFLYAYMEVANAAFYDIATERLVSNTNENN